MTIIREIEGKIYTFGLTLCEMKDAFFEQQHYYDVEDVESIITDQLYSDEFFEVFGITTEQALQQIDRIAICKREREDNYDSYWSEAARDALVWFADEIKKQECVGV